MSQMILTTSNMQMARANCITELRQLDRILFPNGDKSLADRHMSADEVEEAIISYLETKFHQGSVSGNLERFVDAFSKGSFWINNNDTVRKQIIIIASHEAELRRNIEALAGNDSQNGNKSVGKLLTILFSLAVSAGIAIASATRVFAITENPFSSTDDTDVTGSVTILLIVILGISGISGRAYYTSKKKYTSEQNPSVRTVSQKPVCSKKEALEVLDLLVALTAIYRVCEQAIK